MAQEPAVLLITDSVALPGSVVLWVLQEFQDKVANGNSLGLVTQAYDLGGNLNLKPSSLDAVISLAETAGFHTTELLSRIAEALRPGGLLIVKEPVGRTPSLCPNRYADLQVAAAVQTEADLQRNLLLAGFIGLIIAEPLKEAASPGAFSTRNSHSSLSTPLPEPISENIKESSSFAALSQQFNSDITLIKAQKPVWETGAVFEIKKPVILRDEDVRTNVPSTISYYEESSTEKLLFALKENGAANLALPNLSIDTDDLVDEDALLAEEDLERPELQLAVDDCEVGNSGRKACKNCTCGRAELEENGKLTSEQLNNPQSACGNCGLGDAFRCNSCPYRGLPQFKLGEKITLPGSLLMVDA
ncbi:hypothetical protein O6H91_07G117900 [Diphasiastrum complanatum]|uniref:Uncharacterized protein n=1 Tax=Diphasiastrum complanatum TaxID=34168 RepID=A0ACC2D9F2_DIPCM|nr:hypothetical protein O6H91_07G117900 [Diphasiastrum complanatum]